MEYNPPTLGRGDSRSKSTSPLKNLPGTSAEKFNSMLGQLMKKDKEMEVIRAENSKLKDQIKEFEYLIVKASEEVKKKQNEVSELRAVIDGLNKNQIDIGRIGELQNQLIEAKATNKALENQLDQSNINLRLENARERELSVTANAKLNEMKANMEKISNEAKTTAEQLQKSYNQITQKYSRLESEHESTLLVIKDLTNQNTSKDQAIDHAHVIIKKLKDELESIKSENETLQGKVKEYKSKCKTLKKNNLAHQDQIKELEKKGKENEILRKELDRAKEDVNSFIRTRLEDKQKIEDRESLMKTVDSLREQISMLQGENTILSVAITEEQLKTKEICTQLVDKEDLIVRLQDEIRNESSRWKAEMEELKTQALKSFQLTSPAGKSTSTRFHNVVRLNQDLSRSVGSIKTGHPMRAGFIRTTPIRYSKSRSPHRGAIQVHDNLEVEEKVSPIAASRELGQNLATETSGHFGESIRIEKDDSKTTELKIAYLKEELQKSLDREQHLTLVIEGMTAKAELELKSYADKIPEYSQPKTDYEVKIQENIQQITVEKKEQEINHVVLGLTANNRMLVAQIEKLCAELNEAKINYESNITQLLREQQRSDELVQKLLADSKGLYQAYENSEVLTLRDLKDTSSLMRKVTEEGERQRTEIKSLEEMIDNAHLYPSHMTFDDKPSSPLRAKKSIVQKLHSLINNYQNKNTELEEENRKLFDKFTKMEREAQGLKNINTRMEKDFMDSLREKEEAIRAKEELLRQKDEFITQRDHQTNNQIERITELSSKEARIISILNDKEEIIRALLIEKDSILKSLDEVNETCNELKKELRQREDEVFKGHREYTERSKEYSEKCRELNIKQDRIADLQQDLIRKGRELDEKDDEITHKEALLMEKDRKIVQLQHEISMLHEDLAYATTHTGQKRTEASVNYGSIKKNLSLEKSPEPEYNTFPSSKKFQSPLPKSPGFTSEKFEPGFKDKINELTKENRELVQRIQQLNEVIMANKTLYPVVSPRNQTEADREEDYYSTKPSKKKGRMATDQTLPLFEDSFIEYSMNIQDEKGDKDHSRNMKENVYKDKETADYIERYKAKTKKMFQKRVKELELVLRYIDYKIRGFNFKRSSYAVPTQSYEQLGSEEARILSKLEGIVNGMLEKNSNLRSFIHSITRNIEGLYLKEYNVTITLTKLFKALFMNSVDTENYTTLNQFGLLSDLEVLFELNIPNQADSFDHIETVANVPVESRNDFFNVFERIEPKLNFLHEFLLSTMKQTNELKINFTTFKGQAKEFLGVKKESLRDIETLYQKLRQITDKNKQQATVSQESFRNYIHAFHNIFKAVFNESCEIVNFVLRNAYASPEKIQQDTSYLSGLAHNMTRNQSANKTVSAWQPVPIDRRASTTLPNQSLNITGKDDSLNITKVRSPGRTDKKVSQKPSSGQSKTLKPGMMPTTNPHENQKLFNDIIHQLDTMEKTGAPKKRSSSQDNLKGRTRSRTPTKK